MPPNALRTSVSELTAMPPSTINVTDAASRPTTARLPALGASGGYMGTYDTVQWAIQTGLSTVYTLFSLISNYV